MSDLKLIVLSFVVICLLGFAALSWFTGAMDDDFARVADDCGEYLLTSAEFKANAKEHYRKATIAFFMAILVPVMTVMFKRRNKS